MSILQIPTPRWAVPLLPPARYKGAKGGRGSGKSHFFAEQVVKEMVRDPGCPVVCIREIQKSLKFSAKKLIEQKIKKLGVEHLFDVQAAEIKRVGGSGVCIFQGMQDHTADSIKSLEGFKIAWVEEAQRLSARSLKLLRPTIREDDSEIWASWNPDQPTDPIDQLFADMPHGRGVCVHVNYNLNPWFNDVLREEMEHDKAVDIEAYNHVWLGEYNKRSKAQIFAGKWVVDEFEPGPDWSGPYYGADWGFSTDPTALVRMWISPDGETLFVEYEAYGLRVDIDETPALFRTVPGADRYTIHADSARPETISYMVKNGFNVLPADKWTGCVEDGITILRGFKKIVIHTRCVKMQDEARLYSYKIDKLTDEVLPDIISKHDHCWDAVRYGLGPIIKDRLQGFTKKQMTDTKKEPERTTDAPAMEETVW